MKVETRNTFGVPSLLLIAESKAESAMIDEILGKTVGDDGKIANVVGEVRFSDGYCEHYINLKKAEQ